MRKAGPTSWLAAAWQAVQPCFFASASLACAVNGRVASTASSKRFIVNSGVDSGTIGRPAGRADGTAMVGETHPHRVIARC